MKLSMKYWRSSMVVIGIFGALLGSMTAFAAANPNPGVLPPQSHPHGKTYGEWSNAWWKWAFSISVPNNPLIGSYSNGDPKCSAGQSGPVWFLGATVFPVGGQSTPVTRTCTIPTGKALFFPIVNSQRDNVNSCIDHTFTKDNGAELQTLAAGDINSVNVNTLTAQVDGVNIKNLGNYRAGPNNPTYSFTLPQDNLYNFIYNCTAPNLVPSGTYTPAASDGYYLMLAPLSVGSHTIIFKAPDFGVDVTYNLTVK